MGPCPPIESGKGRVVTMTVTHENSHVFELELSGFDARGRAITETLCPTDVHKLYSVERGWVMTKNLRVGEVLRTQTGAATITSIKRKAGDHRVYNFEVEATHAYFVGHTRTLSHNTDCPVTKTTGGTGIGPEGWTVGNRPSQSVGSTQDTLPDKIYRGGTPSPSNLKARPGESSMSYRDSLSNPVPVGERPVFERGGHWFAVDTKKLPPGSVIVDNMPTGHVSATGVPPETMKGAVCDRGKFPK